MQGDLPPGKNILGGCLLMLIGAVVMSLGVIGFIVR